MELAVRRASRVERLGTIRCTQYLLYTSFTESVLSVLRRVAYAADDTPLYTFSFTVTPVYRTRAYGSSHPSPGATSRTIVLYRTIPVGFYLLVS